MRFIFLRECLAINEDQQDNRPKKYKLDDRSDRYPAVFYLRHLFFYCGIV